MKINEGIISPWNFTQTIAGANIIRAPAKLPYLFTSGPIVYEINSKRETAPLIPFKTYWIFNLLYVPGRPLILETNPSNINFEFSSIRTHNSINGEGEGIQTILLELSRFKFMFMPKEIKI